MSAESDGGGGDEGYKAGAPAHVQPAFGFVVRGDHEFPDGKRDQNLRPSPSQVLHLLPMTGRYAWHWLRCLWNGKKPPIDQVLSAYKNIASGH